MLAMFYDLCVCTIVNGVVVLVEKQQNKFIYKKNGRGNDALEIEIELKTCLCR